MVGGFCRFLHPVQDFVIGGTIGAGRDFACLKGAIAGAVMPLFPRLLITYYIM